ncbi:MAG: hypothetical protein EOO05_16140, partial [Chitinophagaceae bacterium]
MKLLDRYNRINLITTILIFILSGIAFYFVLQYTLLKQLDGDLEIEENEIITYIKTNNELPTPVQLKDQQIRFTRLKNVNLHRHFFTVEKGIDGEPQRQLTFAAKVRDDWYKVEVSKSLEGTENIIQLVAAITLSTILLVLITTFMINRRVFKSLWQPFYLSLNVLRGFKLGNAELPDFPRSSIEEFSLLNSTLQEATAKASQEYRSLKTFTENASHELQTPLAIIRSKLEVLMQGPDLSESQSQALQGATEAINKLSRLNQALLLLTKIENNQFSTKELVRLDLLVSEKIDLFREIWQEMALKVNIDIKPCEISVNTALAELLLNNLFSNASRHNFSGGEINVVLHNGVLTIENTSASTGLDN